MLAARREFMLAVAAGAVATRRTGRPQPVVTPEMFGATGDGVTNDTTAFSAMSAHIQKAAGGTIMLAPRKTYVIGRQRNDGDQAYSPATLLEFRQLSRPLVILGNGAELKAYGGLHYGSFDRRSGRPSDPQTARPRDALTASPYEAMIVVRGCKAHVTIRDVVLDGNVSELVVGGPSGSDGWQVAGSGLVLVDNVAGEFIDNVLSRHQPLDGVMISGDPVRLARSTISRLSCKSNGRQGLSFTGGRGYDFIDCTFKDTGRSVVRSPPGAGVDLEGEDGKSIRDLTFTRCRFINNAGAGMGADTGDSADVQFSQCLFVGTTNWSAWPRKPRFRFADCTFAGTLVHAFASSDSSVATRFVRCQFTDDPSWSATGKLYFGGGASGPIVDLDTSINVLFDHCRFDLRRSGILPWTTRAIYRDCVMKQHSSTQAMTRGKYEGQTAIAGPVSLYGSMIVGVVVLNGKVLKPGPVGSGFNPW